MISMTSRLQQKQGIRFRSLFPIKHTLTVPVSSSVHHPNAAMANLTFQITPDSNKDSETIQMGRDLKLSCHVDATPQDKVNYTWYKNGAPVYNSDSLILLRSDPDMAPGTSSLEIVDMKFRDVATYTCVANFPGSRVLELRVDVNISQNSGGFVVMTTWTVISLCHSESLWKFLPFPANSGA